MRRTGWISGRKVQYSACNKLYRRDLIVSRPFPKGAYEDFSWTTSVFCDVDSFAVIDEPLYVYCQNGEASSITRSAFSVSKLTDSFAAIMRVLDYAKGKPSWPFALRQAADGLSSTIGQVYKEMKRVREKSESEGKSESERKSELLSTFNIQLSTLAATHSQVMKKISLKARFRLWNLRRMK